MADIQDNYPPEEPTRQDFPEVKGKIVDSVEITVESDYYGISVRFQDKTSLTLVMESCIFGFPIYEDWTSGEAKLLRQYRPIRSEISTD
jgi:hypothetical protein